MCRNVAVFGNDANYYEGEVMSYECFDITVAEGIAHIRFNRPEKANSMIPSFWTELARRGECAIERGGSAGHCAFC